MEWRKELERRREAEREGSREGMRVRGDYPEARSAGNREEGEERSKQVRGRERCLGKKLSAYPKSASRSREICGGTTGKARAGRQQANTDKAEKARGREEKQRKASQCRTNTLICRGGPGPTVGRVIVSKSTQTRARGGE